MFSSFTKDATVVVSMNSDNLGYASSVLTS